MAYRCTTSLLSRFINNFDISDWDFALFSFCLQFGYIWCYFSITTHTITWTWTFQWLLRSKTEIFLFNLNHLFFSIGKEFHSIVHVLSLDRWINGISISIFIQSFRKFDLTLFFWSRSLKFFYNNTMIIIMFRTVLLVENILILLNDNKARWESQVEIDP